MRACVRLTVGVLIIDVRERAIELKQAAWLVLVNIETVSTDAHG